MKKRIVSLLLVVLMVVSLVPVSHAEGEGDSSTCTHENTETFTAVDGATETWTPVDNREHDWSFDDLTIQRCLDCGHEEIIDRTPKTERHPHDYDAYVVCQHCKHENTCLHENTEHHEELIDKVFTDTGDASMHKETANSYETFDECQDCGQKLNIEVHDEAVEQYRSHIFENGICIFCGHVEGTTCAHTAVEESWGWLGEPTYTTINEQQHEISGQYYTHRHCMECGYEFERQEYTDIRTQVEDHSFDANGLCHECGYQKENICAHENIEEHWEWEDREPEFNYQDTGDDSVHAVTGNAVVTRSCADCGYVFSRVSERRTETESHDYENGVCLLCGHEAAANCQHENTRVEEFEDGYSYRDTGDNRYHEIYVINVTATICEDCGAQVSRDESPNLYSNEEHTYDANNTCSLCGHVNACAHEHTEVRVFEYLDGEQRFEDTGSNQTHHIYGKHVADTVCLDCGMQLSSEIDQNLTLYEEEYSHSYDGSGECTQCHHICSHENLDSPWGWENDSYQYVDKGEYHIQAGTYYTYTYCIDCGKQLSEERLETGERLDTQASHEYDSDGKCVYCGHENACEHLNTYTSDYWKNWDENTFTDTGSNTEHEVSGIYVYCEICSDCGQRLSEREEQYTRMEGHDYDENGYCWRCGHTNTCAHENQGESWWWENDSYQYVDKGEYHIQAGTYYTYTYCIDCGKRLSEERLETGERLDTQASHEYDSDDKCIYCGHENPCEHENAFETWSFYWEEVNYQAIDNAQHEVAGEYYTYLHCPDCGRSIIIQEHAGTRTEMNSHEYDENDVCRWCKHQNTCEHTNTHEDWYWKNWDEREFRDIGSNSEHEAFGVVIRYTDCNDCGKRLSEQEEQHSQKESHDYDENGVCRQCGHVNSCEHLNTYINDYWKNWDENTFTDTGSNREHEVSGIYVYCEICSDCGQRLSEREEERVDLVGHDYNEAGYCWRCGHTNTCAHENQGESWWWENDSYQYVDKGEYHVQAGTYYTYTYCQDCGKRLSEEHLETGERLDSQSSHEYGMDGKCVYCGHENACEHLNTYTSDYWKNWDENTFTDTGSDREHEVSGIYVYCEICSDCGQRLSEREEQYTRMEGHDYDENDVCRWCNHQNTCEHTNTLEGWYWKNWDECEFRDIGSNKEHEVFGAVIRYTDCNDCGQRISELEEQHSEIEGHVYDESMVCRQCEHENTCEHKNTRTDNYSIFTSYTDVGDNRYHDAVLSHVTRTFCDDCGIEISRVETEGTSPGYQHNYDENGVCRDCHHVNTCEHPSMEERWYWKDWDNLTVTDTGSDGEHMVEGMVDWYAECYDCGQMFWEREELYSHAERHSYNEFGVCTLCGHENACEHANADQGWGWSDGSPRYEAVDNRNHVLVGNYYTYWHCQDCGMEFDRQEHEEERTNGPWPHNYDENGVCLDCGHENTCEHVHTEQRVDACWDGTYRYEDTGDNRLHKMFGRHTVRTLCLDCGVEVASELDENLTLYGEFAHDYDENGVCLQCQHQNTCKHEHKKAVSTVYEAEQYTALDNTYHSLAGTGATWFRCIDCGQDRLELQENVPVSIKERHWYGQVGVCDSCGHVNTCTHENMIEDTWPMDVGNCEEIPGDNYSHIAQVYLEHNYSCPDCAYYKNEDDNVPTTMRLRHSYDENGICFECGHKNTCAHENVYTWRDLEGVVFSEIAGDNRYCQAYAAQYGVITECEDCGQTLNREFHNEPITERWGHDYDANGECTRCGHVNTCEHAHLNTYTWWQNDNTVTYQEIEGNNELHRATGLYCEYTYCADCGVELSRVNHDEPRTLISRHDYHGGVCRQCGHVNTCEHEQTITETWWQDYDNRSYQEIEGDNRQHIVTGLYYEYKYCLDCGTELDRVYCSEPRTAKEWHHYGNGDVCEQCGHKNTCTHEDAHEETWWNDTDALIVEQIEGDNRYHMATGKYHSYTRCSECGVEFNVIYFEEPRTIKQDHEYDSNGVCKRCGYVNQCQHENTEEITSLYDAEYNDFGDNYYHQAIANRYVTYLYCHDCGQEFNREAHNEQITLNWRHNYSNHNICRNCKHEYVAPVITLQPRSVTVGVGKTATFTVAASEENVMYQWYYQKPGVSGWNIVTVNGTSATYTLTAQARHNGYTYRCIVSNSDGEATSSVAALTVKSAPTITTQPSSVTVAAGKTATFKVVAGGEDLSYQWYYQKPGASGWNIVTVNGTSATYTLTAQARHNGYTYHCVVSNSDGEATSNTATLTVK